MNFPLLLAGLFAAFVSTSALAQSGPFDQAPSPTVVYGDLVTVGGASMDDGLSNHGKSASSIRG